MFGYWFITLVLQSVALNEPVMASDLRDYSQEILQRPLPVIETPAVENLFTGTAVAPLPPAQFASTSLQVEGEPRTTRKPTTTTDSFSRRAAWAANVNSAISGKANRHTHTHTRHYCLLPQYIHKINFTLISSFRRKMTQSSKLVIRFSSWPSTRISLTAL